MKRRTLAVWIRMRKCSQFLTASSRSLPRCESLRRYHSRNAAHERQFGSKPHGSFRFVIFDLRSDQARPFQLFIFDLWQLISSLVAMVCESIPQVRASAIYALASIRSTTVYIIPLGGRGGGVNTYLKSRCRSIGFSIHPIR